MVVLSKAMFARNSDWINNKAYLLDGQKSQLNWDLLGRGDRVKAGQRLDDGLGLPLPDWTNLETLIAPFDAYGFFLAMIGRAK